MSWIGITGAAQGLGLEMSEIFMAQGHRVIGLDINQAGLGELSQRHPEKFKAITIDLSSSSSYLPILDQLYKEEGVPTLWINNAGMAVVSRFEKTYLSFAKVMQVNFQAVVDLCHFWLAPMEKNGGGTLVNIASVAGHVAAPFFTSYSASKFAVVGFSQALQAELKLKKSPVKIVLLSPGFVDTAIMRGQDLALPEFLNFLRPGPKDCAKEMVSAILDGKDFELPTLNGKVMYQIARIGGPLKDLTLKLMTQKLPPNIWDK